MNKIGLVVIIILLGINIIGCKEDEVLVMEEEIISEKEVKEKEIPKKQGLPSPLSGLYASEIRVKRRPVAVMFDNHPRARWQSGLKDAEIVYEFSVEAPYTRYMGIYLINEPDLVGPIRSSRPYFVTSVLEYDAVYARVGGSEQAKSDIKSYKVADIDGLTSSRDVYWRESHKKRPNNMYTSIKKLRETQMEMGYENLGDFDSFKFNEEDLNNSGEKAEKITINYRKDNTTSYDYDYEKKLYKRSKDGKLHIDEKDQSQIIAKNIIIQEARTKVIDSEGRLDIELIGQGRGKYISNGKITDVEWIKKTRTGKTLYYDLEGNEIRLNPGVTWIQIVDINPDITIE